MRRGWSALRRSSPLDRGRVRERAVVIATGTRLELEVPIPGVLDREARIADTGIPERFAVGLATLRQVAAVGTVKSGETGCRDRGAYAVERRQP